MPPVLAYVWANQKELVRFGRTMDQILQICRSTSEDLFSC